MEYVYNTKDTCAKQIKFQLDGDVITNIEFDGGCNGNLKAIPKFIDGWTVGQIEEKCAGITCGRRPTSCTDQLAKAVRKAYDEARA